MFENEPYPEIYTLIYFKSFLPYLNFYLLSSRSRAYYDRRGLEKREKISGENEDLYFIRASHIEILHWVMYLVSTEGVFTASKLLYAFYVHWNYAYALVLDNTQNFFFFFWEIDNTQMNTRIIHGPIERTCFLSSCIWYGEWLQVGTIWTHGLPSLSLVE